MLQFERRSVHLVGLIKLALRSDVGTSIFCLATGPLNVFEVFIIVDGLANGQAFVEVECPVFGSTYWILAASCENENERQKAENSRFHAIEI